MRYWVRSVLGLGLFIAAFVTFEYAVYELMQTGTCASGGPYVSARECPDGTFAKGLLIPVTFIAGAVGLLVFALRGDRPGRLRSRGGGGGVLLVWTGLFVVTGVVALVAGFTSADPDAGTARWTGVFLAVLFGAIGLLPVALMGVGRRRQRH